MQQQTVVSDSGFLKYSWAHVAIFNTAAWWFLMQYHLRAQRSSTFNWCFLPCPTCTVISLAFLNLFTILRVVLGERPKFFAILHCEMWFFYLFDTSLVNLCTKWWAMTHSILYPNTIPWLITNSPAYCELFQNSLTWIFYNLYAFILPLSQLFWNVFQPLKS